MANYPDPDAWFDNSPVPWGITDWDNPEPGKVDTLRKSLWGTNRAVYGIWDAVKGLPSAEKIHSIVVGVLRAQEFNVNGLGQKLDDLNAKVDALVAALAAANAK